ncbi:MAG: DPP IV N-terminal domain-containing protein [Sphingomonas sp.]|uniref:S9 family peptidase n=1 Tax=Sphingomonas sp. TaxID=28214 RepID=UPI001AD2C936|nr:DPP IV N-terminal domain-containing protein [Sphingomonas sp.]MBN8814624.1 DPP IV N-terminal domain-containing protein [Sphingomonas sp.]
MRAWLIGLAAVAAPVVVLGGAAMAVEEGAQPLTLERLFASPDLSGAQPRNLKLSPDGSLLTFTKARTDERERFDLWARDTATGVERMLVDSKKVGSGADLTEAEKMQRERARIGGDKGIVAYDWSPDGKSILVPLDGDLYLATLDGKVVRLTNMPGGQLNPVVSPGGGYVSFVRNQNLFVQPLSGGAARALTGDGAGTVHWGEAEFVAQEEMDRRTGYWWAPGDKLVAVERFDEAPVGVVTRAAIGANGTKVFDQRYPAAGTPNVTVELYVIDPATGGKVKVDLGGDPDIYLARVNWSPDGKTLYVQRENRDQTQLDMLAVDPATGKAKVWFSEKAAPKSWINLSENYRLLKDGSLIWWSERDGFGHLYRFANGKWTQLTKGKWQVTDLVGVDQAHGRLYFMANKDDALESQLYSLAIDKPDAITRLTERGWTNRASMNPAANRLIVTRSNPNQPPQTYLADTSGKMIGWINENAVKPGHPYYPYLAAHRQRTFGTIKADDDTLLYYEMITPPLEPGKKYPVFFQHYGGPHSQTVTRGWENPMEQYIVSKGYIFFQLDNRGSPNRGKAFEDAIYRAMGSIEVQDQLVGAKWLKTQPYVDGDRIGIYGWSYGGYMTLKMLEANPGVYAGGVSGAPVTRWELYDTHYTERYMGARPKGGDAAAYAASNAIDNAAKIADPLMLIHGMADDNVVLDNSTAFAARMQAANRPFEMMFYPGKTHSAGRDIHVWTTIFNFFDRTVKNRGK